MTIWSELPDAAGKSFWSRLNACADWVFGSWNFVEKSVPATRVAAKVPTSATSQSTRTTLRCRKHHLPRDATAKPPENLITYLPTGR